jgi:hypothetical protein
MVTGEGWRLDRRSIREDSDRASARLQESLLIGAAAVVHQAVERSCSRHGHGAAVRGTGTNLGWRQGGGGRVWWKF